MCTAANYKSKNHYFGRNFDYEQSYNERIIITPRNYSFKFRKINDINKHYAIIGIAAGIEEYPLYYDAINEKGLGIAGLNFPDYTEYKEENSEKTNITPFELIPYILSQCKNIEETKILLNDINLVNINFSEELPLSPLHWIISDKDSSITVECVKEGLKIYDNPIGILTNNPPFDKQLFNLNNYRNLSNKTPENKFIPDLDLEVYSRGMGGLGLPGDLSSMSRFVKATFTKLNSLYENSENGSVNQFFHILESVEQQKGCTLVKEPDEFEFTIYSSCFNTTKGILYYKTYENSQINAVNMNKEDLEDKNLITYPLITKTQINFQN